MKNVNLYFYKGLALMIKDKSLGANRLHLFCLIKNIPLIRIHKKEKCPDDYIPCGSVEWCTNSLGFNVIPDYYPEWAKDHLYRKVWKSSEWLLGKKLFVKPADRYKRFTGFVTDGYYKKKKKPPLWYSEIIKFENEWRYYISNGKIICSGWYSGDEINTPDAPELNIEIPKDYSGALDFGADQKGRMVLVESQHPFACGWYGKHEEDYLYFQWLIDGWLYMKNLHLDQSVMTLEDFKKGAAKAEIFEKVTKEIIEENNGVVLNGGIT